MNWAFLAALTLSNFLSQGKPNVFWQTTAYADEATPQFSLQSQDAPQKKGPHGGQVVTHKGKKFEIKLDPESKKLHVYTPTDNSTTTQPNNLGIVLYKSDKTGETVRLKTVEIPQTGFLHYQGEISPTEAPYVAFGLQFDLSKTPESKPYENK